MRKIKFVLFFLVFVRKLDEYDFNLINFATEFTFSGKISHCLKSQKKPNMQTVATNKPKFIEKFDKNPIFLTILETEFTLSIKISHF
jgi:hypothetical protein